MIRHLNVFWMFTLTPLSVITLCQHGRDAFFGSVFAINIDTLSFLGDRIVDHNCPYLVSKDTCPFGRPDAAPFHCASHFDRCSQPTVDPSNWTALRLDRCPQDLPFPLRLSYQVSIKYLIQWFQFQRPALVTAVTAGGSSFHRRFKPFWPRLAGFRGVRVHVPTISTLSSQVPFDSQAFSIDPSSDYQTNSQCGFNISLIFEHEGCQHQCSTLRWARALDYGSFQRFPSALSNSSLYQVHRPLWSFVCALFPEFD